MLSLGSILTPASETTAAASSGTAKVPIYLLVASSPLIPPSPALAPTYSPACIGFSQSAQNVHYAVEGDGQAPVLRADLVGGDGELCGADVNLAERIQNQNGNFVFGIFIVCIHSWCRC